MKKYIKYLIFIIPVVLIIILIMLPTAPQKQNYIYNTSYEKSDIIKVYVDGEVKNKGYYSLLKGSTIGDLLRKCEMTDCTDIANIDEKLKDNYSYNISYKSQSEKEVIVKSYESPSNLDTKDTELININTASISVLMTLEGIGSVKANSIISYRKEKRFNDIEEIKNVNGITSQIYDKIKNCITV